MTYYRKTTNWAILAIAWGVLNYDTLQLWRIGVSFVLTAATIRSLVIEHRHNAQADRHLSQASQDRHPVSRNTFPNPIRDSRGRFTSNNNNAGWDRSWRANESAYERQSRNHEAQIAIDQQVEAFALVLESPMKTKDGIDYHPPVNKRL